MPTPKDPAELALVRKAITCGTGGCCEWHAKAEAIFRDEVALPGQTPLGVKDDLIEYVSQGGEVKQMKEQREEYREERAYWYKVVLAVPELKHGLFIEIILVNRDPDLPEVRIVRAKPSTR